MVGRDIILSEKSLTFTNLAFFTAGQFSKQHPEIKKDALKQRVFISSLLILNLLLINPSLIWAAGEISITSSQTATVYAEATDSQTTVLGGSGNALGYRSVEALGFLDLGLEWGTYTVDGKTGLHEIELSTDFVNLMTGLSFRLSPSWLDYTLDLGYRVSVNRMELHRTNADGKVDQHKIGQLAQEPFYRLGVRIFLGDTLFFGLSREQQSKLFEKSVEDLKPKVTTAASTLMTIGYRFGGSSRATQINTPSYIPSGPTNYNNPCRLFKACN